MLINYKDKYKGREDVIKFIDYFLLSAYVNMDIENEAVFDKEELYDRYRIIVDSLVEKWVYKWLKYKS